MGLDEEYITNQNTLLREEEKLGLRHSSIASRAELYALEQQNMEEALQNLQGKHFEIEKVLNEKFILALHHQMFGKVWARAGQFRTGQVKSGLHYSQIPPALNQLCADALFWNEHKVYSPEEIAIRFKKGLLSIQCFSTGNRRHSRLMADILIHQVFHQALFTWGATLSDIAREEYLKALKAADRNSFEALLRFSKS